MFGDWSLDSHKSSLLIFRTDGCSLWGGGLSKTLENIVKLERPTFSKVVARPLVDWLLYCFLTQIFLQLVVLEKEYRKQNWETNTVKIVKIVDKVAKNFTRGRWIPIDSVKSWNYFGNYSHKIVGMGCIDSNKSNPVYLVGSYCKKPGWNYLKQMGSVWNMNSY